MQAAGINNNVKESQNFLKIYTKTATTRNSNKTWAYRQRRFRGSLYIATAFTVEYILCVSKFQVGHALVTTPFYLYNVPTKQHTYIIVTKKTHTLYDAEVLP